MLKSRIKLTAIFALLFIATVLSAFQAYATTDPPYVTMFRGQVDSIQVNNEIITRDLNFYDDSTSIEKTFEIQNIISVGIDESSPYFIQSDFDVTITLELTITRANNTDTVYTRDFRIDYKKAITNKNGILVYHAFKNGYTVKAKIISITPASSISWDYKKVLIIKNELTATRDYIFNCLDVMPVPTITVPIVEFPDEFLVTWDDPDNGQTEYDLEWAWIDESAVDLYKNGSAFDQAKLFNNNATRVTLSASVSSYSIPLLYDGDGRIFIRLRPVQTKQSGQRVEGFWSETVADTDNDMFVFTGHQENLNWQASTSFAEDGKRKSVVQYFDGSLRSRQTVTKDNSTATLLTSGATVVAETFYDYQGRAVIQVLPAPTLSTIIAFSHNFNQSIEAEFGGYPKTLYDKLSSNGSICADPAPELSKDYGASKYYSPVNSQKDDGIHKYIPDALEFPFTETRYKPDGSGVASQGGVGIDHRLGSGHETKYMEEVPAQSQLDKLFGTDVGINTHYSKNWVKDANGQYSVSYVDMKGRTVATALAGKSPTTLMELESLNTTTITKKLLDPTTNVINGRSIVSTSSIVLGKDVDVKFNYSLTQEQFKLLNCEEDEVCYDCLYDLIITVIPECNVEAIIGNPHVVSNFTLGDYGNSNDCAANSPLFNEEFTLSLKEGAYTVTKELRLSKDAQDYLRDSIYMPANTCKLLQDYIDEQYELLIAQTNCNITCEACTTSIGSNFSAFVNSILLKAGLTVADTTGMTAQLQIAYDEAKAACERICNRDHDNGLGNIENMRKIMLLDMTPPGGQYAKLTAGPTQVYNIFSNFTPPANAYILGITQTPFYLNPLNLTTGLNPLLAASYTNNHIYWDVFGNAQLDVSTTAGSTPLTPQEFSDQFQPNWAEALLPYHPEFHKLIATETKLRLTNEFEGKVNDAETWAQAVSEDFINDILEQDPFFTGSTAPGAAFEAAMATKMATYFTSNICSSPASLSMWQVAQASVFCRNLPDNQSCSTNLQFNCAAALLTTPNETPVASVGCVDWDYAWKAFKTTYLGERKKFIDLFLQNECPGIDNDQIESYNTSTNIVFTVHFPEFASATNASGIGDIITQINAGNYTQSVAASQQAAQQQYDSTCKGYATMWFNKLMLCEGIRNVMNDTDSTWIINTLRSICKAGSDIDHFLGSSSIYDLDPPIHAGSPYPGDYRSFPQVIVAYLDMKDIDIDALCHPYMIPDPKPYDKQPSIANLPVVTKPLDCQCNLISDYKNEFIASGLSGTFSQYLLTRHGTTITQGALDTLQSLCSGVYTCNFIPKAIKLPPIFQCKGKNQAPPKACINCEDFRKIKRDYITLFAPGIDVPIVDPQNQAAIATNISFAAYANYETGFSKHWSEWLAFQQQCVDTSGISCDSLKIVLGLFYQSEAYLEDPIGADCRTAFTDFFNDYFGTSYSYDDIMNLYQECGYVPEVCKPKLTCEDFSKLVNDFYDEYGVTVFSNSNCSSMFVTYFNLKQHTDYTYSEIEELYKSCGCSFEICTYKNCILLTRFYNSFKTFYGNAWSSSDCKEIFVDYFNDYFGFVTPNEKNWDSIYGAFQNCFKEGCGPDLGTLCMPPYTCKTLNGLIELFYAEFGNEISINVNCADSFAFFFNEQMQTAYTYEQIVEIYMALCGIQLDVCSIKYECKELVLVMKQFRDSVVYNSSDCKVKFTEFFNDRYNVLYNYEDINKVYINACGKMPGLCGNEIILTDEKQLRKFLEEFMVLYPDPIAKFGNECQAVFAEVFNSRFATRYNYDTIAKHYRVVCNLQLEVCNSSCNLYNQIVSKMPTTLCKSLKLPLLAGQQVFASFFNKQLLDMGMEQMEVSQVVTAVTSCPDTGGCRKLIIDSTAYSIADPDVFESMLQAYYLLHPDGLSENWGVDFTAWIRLCMQDSAANPALTSMVNSAVSNEEIILPQVPQKSIMLREAVPPDPVTFTAPLLCGLNNPIYPDPPPIPGACDDLLTVATGFAEDQYELYKDSLRNVFDTAYMNKCLAAKNLETFTAEYPSSEYHYTLYYYDQAGNLVKTIPPAGIHDNFDASGVVAARTAGTILTPAHTLATNYRYNTLNQVVAQLTPDAGKSEFWYDRLGRLVVSQNAKQAVTLNDYKRYSYTIYDDLGRINEVGEKPKVSSAVMTQLVSQDQTGITGLNAWLNTSTTAERKQQITRTVYDEPYSLFCGTPHLLCQQNLRNRVSYTYVKNSDDPDPNYPWDAASFYSYDIHGNVDTLLQDYKTSMGAINCGSEPSGNRWKKLVYNYDLISGKVNEVAYQPGQADQFFHRYEYDAENRLTAAQTSRDKLYWETDAQYNYYKHGPLARTVLGQTQVQGIDYAYTLQGWLKGVNSTTGSQGTIGGGNDCGANTAVDDLFVNERLLPNQAQYIARSSITFQDEFESDSLDEFVAFIDTTLLGCAETQGVAGNDISNHIYMDMGQDGIIGSGNPHLLVARDAYGFNLNYYNNDYKPITSIADDQTPFAKVNMPMPIPPLSVGVITGSQLFNGNIGSMMVDVPKLGEARLYTYQYDQLNRITRMDANMGDYETNNNFTPAPLDLDQYHEQISYDPNGNIKNYKRNGTTQNNSPVAMDDLAYEYIPNTNKLKRVTDAVSNANYPSDIDNQAEVENYVYDEIGNLVEDKSEGLHKIDWTVYGKIAKIEKVKPGTSTDIEYTYDASGNRISKKITITKTIGGIPQTPTVTHTYYVRDASGNVMSIYNADATINEGDLTQTEMHLYGSSRLGIYNVKENVQCLPVSTDLTTFIRGNKFFELSNHLGNVLATLSDKKLSVDEDDDGQIDRYIADIVTANDYYPFGMLMPGRQFDAGNKYRYGFNGKEDDNEAFGDGNSYDYGFRIYNPRLGRFLSVDPLKKDYPGISPYPFAMNDVIRAIDIDGLELYYVVNYWENDKIKRTSIEAYTDIKSGRALNMQHKLSSGEPVTTQDVLIYDVYNEGTRKEQIFRSDAPVLTPEQKKIFNSAFAVEKFVAGKATVSNELDEGVSGEISSENGMKQLFGERSYKNDDEGGGAGKKLKKFKYKFSGIGSFIGGKPGSLVGGTNSGDIHVDANSKEFLLLPNKIKSDGTIKSIDIHIPAAISVTLTQIEQNKILESYKILGENMKANLLKSGVKNINYRVEPITYSPNYSVEGNNRPDTPVTITLNK